MTTRAEHVDELEGKIKYLSEATWEGRVTLPMIRDWTRQFQIGADLDGDEQLHALFLLGHFLYFGQAEIRELLRSVYRDLYRAPRMREIRRQNSDTKDISVIEAGYQSVRDKTRFLGMGNPSESGSHLLYYFRQENSLPKTLFINSHEIFSRLIPPSGGISVAVRDASVEQYVFIDDLCGSGTQATAYSTDLVIPLKQLDPKARVSYLVLFATTDGLSAVRGLGCFDEVQCIFELDETFRSLEPRSRIFEGENVFSRERVRATCEKYGSELLPGHPLGYKNGQLLVAFSHNTPDNTLPIFWQTEGTQGPWQPIFRRYNKDYGP